MTKDIFDENKRTGIDYQINIYTIKCLKIMFLSIILMWFLNVVHIFIVSMELVTCGFLVSCGVLVLIIITSWIVDLLKSWV